MSMPWTEVRRRSYCTGNRPPRIAASSVPAASGDRRFFTVSARSTGFSLGNLRGIPFSSGASMYDYTRLFLRLTAVLSHSPGASLRKIAAELRIHPHTVALVVRRRTGLTYSAWRASRQFEIATRLLASRADLSIKEIAAAAGFSSTSVFDRFIRRRCGRSPTEWRCVLARRSTALVRTSTFWTIHQHSRGLTTPTPMPHSSHPPRRLCSSSNETSWLPGVASTRCSGRSSGDDVVAAPGRERCRIRRGSR